MKASFIDATKTSDSAMDKATWRWMQMKQFMETHEYIMNADVRTLCNVSTATTKRILVSFVAEEEFIKYWHNGHRVYTLSK